MAFGNLVSMTAIGAAVYALDGSVSYLRLCVAGCAQNVGETRLCFGYDAPSICRRDGNLVVRLLVL